LDDHYIPPEGNQTLNYKY